MHFFFTKNYVGNRQPHLKKYQKRPQKVKKIEKKRKKKWKKTKKNEKKRKKNEKVRFLTKKSPPIDPKQKVVLYRLYSEIFPSCLRAKKVRFSRNFSQTSEKKSKKNKKNAKKSEKNAPIYSRYFVFFLPQKTVKKRVSKKNAFFAKKKCMGLARQNENFFHFFKKPKKSS